MPPIIRPLLDTVRLLASGKPKYGDTSSYFGPGIVIPPMAPEGTEARGWNYWPFFNQNILPRPDAQYTFQELRALALYPLARICIENCKDIIAAKPRQIRIKKQHGETNKDVDKRGQGDKTLKMLNEFFDCPDGQHDWDSWIRPWLDDIYVTDAASILVRRTGAGTVRQLRVIDGSAVTCKIDELGYRPEPPGTAYQWLWSGTPSTNGGIPFVNLTTDQLVYRPRNIVPRNTVSSYLYGMSPTEQNAEEIKLGQLRLAFWIYCYTNGNMPDMIHVVPPNVNSDNMKLAQKALDSEMSGQLYKQARSIHLLQGFVDRSMPGAASGDQFIQTKEKLLVDPLDEMHIRKVAFGYGASAQRLMKQMNRASAQAGQEASEEEGTQPIAQSVKGMVDWIIAVIFKCGFNAYELTYDEAEELDAVKRAAADKSDVDSGIISRDESRIKRGMDPAGGDAAKLMITTASGTVPVEMADQVKQAVAMAAAMPKPEPKPAGGNNKVAKRGEIKMDPARLTHHARHAQGRLEHAINKVFNRQKDKAAHEATKLLKDRRAQKADESDSKRIADKIFAAIESEFASLPVEARSALEQAAISGVNDAYLQIEITDAGVISSVNAKAAEFASRRAAEMVGMKYDDAGELVENPNAKYAISSTTRDRLREIIKKAFEEKTPMESIIADIRDADIFSESRAELIARTEVANAQVKGQFDTWKSSGVVSKVKWLAVGPNPCPICEDNDGVTRVLGARFPSGDTMPTAHPNCYCTMVAVFE